MFGLETAAAVTDGQSLYKNNHRFAFACEQVAGLKVLDLLCGQGDGSAILAAVAAEVVAIDADGNAIARAKELYGSLGSVTFHKGDLDRLPFGDSLFDAVVSFQALAQDSAPEDLISEIRRVLKPEGFALFSLEKTREVGLLGASKPARSSESSIGVLENNFRKNFSNVAVYGQRIVAASSLSPLNTTDRAPNVADYRGYRTTDYAGGLPKTGPGVVRFSNPDNFICFASNAPIPHVVGPDSIFLMDSIDLWAEQSSVQSQILRLQAENIELEAKDKIIENLTGDLQQARGRIDSLLEARDSLERALMGQTDRGSGVTDLSVIGPIMEELAGKPVPADVPHLIRLLGQIAVRTARQDMRVLELERLQPLVKSLQDDLDRQIIVARDAVTSHKAETIASQRSAEAAAEAAVLLSQAREEITALSATKRDLISDLDDISADAESQAKVLQLAAAKAEESSAIFADQVNQQSELLTEVLRDLAQMTDRETETAHANLALIAARDDLEVRLATSRHIEEESNAERRTLEVQLAELKQSLILAEAGKHAVDESLAELDSLKHVAERQKEAALSALDEAMTREHAAQTEILRRTEAESRLAEACGQAASELADAQSVINGQGEEISRLIDERSRANLALEANQQAFMQQAAKLSELEDAALAFQANLGTVNDNLQALNATVLEAAATELTLRAECEAWASQSNAWHSERSDLQAESEAWASQARAWHSERSALQAESEAWASEARAWRSERNALQAERDTWALKAKAWNSERDTHLAEREVWNLERDTWSDERNTLALALAEASQKVSESVALLQSAPWWSRLFSLR